MQRDQGQVQREQQAAAEVAQRPAADGDPVALVRSGDPAQDRVVDDQRRAQAQVGDDQQHARRAASWCRSTKNIARPRPRAGPGEAGRGAGRAAADRSAIAPTKTSTSADTMVASGQRCRGPASPGETGMPRTSEVWCDRPAPSARSGHAAALATEVR